MSDKTEVMDANDLDAAKSVLSVDGVGRIVALPSDYQVQSLEAFQPVPNGANVGTSFRNAKSLAAYLNRFATENTVLFSRPKSFEVEAAIDYHEPKGAASHVTHKPSYNAQFTSSYRKWRSIHGVNKAQIDAGLFLEERAVDVVEPEAASIMDMVLQFDALKKVTFRQSARLHDGQRQFTYNEENEVRGNVTMPEKIKLLIPVFEGQEPQPILVRVRYRIDDGRLIFKFEIHDRDDLEDEAFQRCEDALLTDLDTEIPVYHCV